MAGENLLICCSNEGEVRGFKFSEQDANTVAANVYKDRQEAIRDLAQKKQVRRFSSYDLTPFIDGISGNVSGIAQSGRSSEKNQGHKQYEYQAIPHRFRSRDPCS